MQLASARVFAIDPVGLQAAIEAQERHTGGLMAMEGVVGVAVGARADGKPVIKVYTVQETPQLLDRIPAAIEGYRVVVEETGEIHARP